MTFAAQIMATLIRAYRSLVSPLLGPSCRYYPTCSDYALQAIAQHGALRGLWIAITRIMRCHPWGGSGLDPVPGTADWDRVNSGEFRNPESANHPHPHNG